MNNKQITVKKPMPCGCPRCWNIIKTARMDGEYIVYECMLCGWETPRDPFYKIGKSKDKK